MWSLTSFANAFILTTSRLGLINIFTLNIWANINLPCYVQLILGICSMRGVFRKLFLLPRLIYLLFEETFLWYLKENIADHKHL